MIGGVPLKWQTLFVIVAVISFFVLYSFTALTF